MYLAKQDLIYVHNNGFRNHGEHNLESMCLPPFLYLTYLKLYGNIDQITISVAHLMNLEYHTLVVDLTA